MRNYFKNLDYTIPLVLMIILTAFLCSCNEHEVVKTSDVPREVKIENANLADTRYSVFILDSCEYIVYGWSSRDDHVITHKGNCKFCIERMKNLLKK
jgi:hypothetical protein